MPKMVNREKDAYVALGAAIRDMRVENGKTQVEIAQMLGVSFQQVQKYESGENRIGLFRLAHLCREMKYPFDKLVQRVMD